MNAIVNIVVTDQGNGGASCSNCGTGVDTALDEARKKRQPPKCPNCGYNLVGESVYINWGGSDF